MALFARYIQGIQLMLIIERMFGSIRKSKNSFAVTELFVQVLCFFMDGTSRHLSWFDHPKLDESYTTLLSANVENLASSHSVKRFLVGFLLYVSVCFVICCKIC